MVSNLTQRIEQALNARAAQAQQAATATAQALAVAQFNRVWQMLVDDPRLDVQDAVAAVQVEFDGQFVESMAEAFSALLLRSVGTAQVRAMRVGDITLSQHLYRHRRRVQAEVTALVREHAKGVQQAQALAMRLYDGYNPADGIRRPLEGAARARLPKALRKLTADPAARASLQRVVDSGQAQAARLKTRGLRAAYEEAFEAWRAGAGQDALRRKLEVALREKNRMYAERIARTELARAHQAEVAEVFMRDASIEVVQVRLNPRHPIADVCDLHARADLYGLGPGCYPKAKAPRPPYHPYCACRVTSRPDLAEDEARSVDDPSAQARAYLRSLPSAEAARVLGSRERLQRALQGADPIRLIDAGKPAQYRTQRLGDVRPSPLPESP